MYTQDELEQPFSVETIEVPVEVTNSAGESIDSETLTKEVLVVKPEPKYKTARYVTEVPIQDLLQNLRWNDRVKVIDASWNNREQKLELTIMHPELKGYELGKDDPFKTVTITTKQEYSCASSS